MSNHTDPFHRRESYHASSLTPSSAQEKRRRLALDAQKLRRTHAIEAARNMSRDLFDMEDLSLAPSPASSDDEPASRSPALEASCSPMPLPHISKQKRKSHKPTFKSWAKNLLTQAETLDLREGVLPYGFERDWRMSIVPKGKRCLCATSNDSAGKNTILYSRVAGRTLGRLHSILPGDCLLDVVWDREKSILWVLDTMKWRGNYIVECEADFRAFFTNSKLSELSTQYYVPSTTTDPSTPPSRPLLILPSPTYSSPLIPSTLLPILAPLSTPSLLPVSVLVTTSGPNGGGIVQQTVQIPFEPIGLLLYHQQSHYESGLTPLVNWVPVQVDLENARDKIEGVGRLIEVVREWEERGGEAGRVQQTMMEEEEDGEELPAREEEHANGREGDPSQATASLGNVSSTTRADFTTMRG